jgi:hypothetical protein
MTSLIDAIRNDSAMSPVHSACQAGCCAYVSVTMPDIPSVNKMDANTLAFMTHEQSMRVVWDTRLDDRNDPSKRAIFLGYFKARAILFGLPDTGAFNGEYYFLNDVDGAIAFPWSIASLREIKNELYGDLSKLSTETAVNWLKLWKQIKLCAEYVIMNNTVLHSRSPTELYYNKLPPLSIASSEAAERIQDRHFTPIWLKDIVSNCDCCGVHADQLFSPQPCEEMCYRTARAYIDQVRGGMGGEQAIQLIMPHHYCEACAIEFMGWDGIDHEGTTCPCCESGTPHKAGSLRYCREKNWIGDLTQELSGDPPAPEKFKPYPVFDKFTGLVGSIPRPKSALPRIENYSKNDREADNIMIDNMKKDAWLNAIDAQIQMEDGMQSDVAMEIINRPANPMPTVLEEEERDIIEKLPGIHTGGKTHPRCTYRRCAACDAEA